MDDENALYSIGSVARLAGVTASTLRNWERRYSIPRPSRVTDGGQRLYTAVDVATAVAMARRTATGLPAGKAADVLREERLRPELLARAFLAAAERMDAADLKQSLDEAAVLFAPEQMWHGIVAPALRRLGVCAAETGAGIGAEHLASSMVMTWLRGLLEATAEPPEAPMVVVACGPGELHELGSLMFVRALRRQGLRALYAGANSPLTALREARRLPRAAMLCATATMAATAEDLLELLPLLEQAAAPAARLALAGPGFTALGGQCDDLSGEAVYLGDDIEGAAQRIRALLLAAAAS